MYTVWSKDDGVVYYDPVKGYFSAQASGWWGPDDLTLLGVYALINPDGDFGEFRDKILDKLPEPERHGVIIKPSWTDIFWVYLGSRNYHYLTGKMGQEPPWDHLLVGEEEQDKYYVSWDSKKMEKTIDKILKKLSAGKSAAQMAEDSKRKNEWLEYFTDEIQASGILKVKKW